MCDISSLPSARTGEIVSRPRGEQSIATKRSASSLCYSLLALSMEIQERTREVMMLFISKLIDGLVVDAWRPIISARQLDSSEEEECHDEVAGFLRHTIHSPKVNRIAIGKQVNFPVIRRKDEVRSNQ